MVSPTAAPPVQAVTAPVPALKQARGPRTVKTGTAEAVDATDQSGAEPKAVQRRNQRGGRLDILV